MNGYGLGSWWEPSRPANLCTGCRLITFQADGLCLVCKGERRRKGRGGQ